MGSHAECQIRLDTMTSVLKKIISLIYAPNLDDPLEPEIAELYAKNPKEFEARAKEYVAKYAKWVAFKQIYKFHKILHSFCQKVFFFLAGAGFAFLLM